MEEEIKILEEMLKASKENDMYEGNKYFKSLEYLIKAYKDLKEIEESHRKENGELRERVKELEMKLDDKETELQILKDDIKADEIMYKDEKKKKYIPVSLVEEKIEELTKEGRHYNANKIEVLQELLEKR